MESKIYDMKGDLMYRIVVVKEAEPMRSDVKADDGSTYTRTYSCFSGADVKVYDGHGNLLDDVSALHFSVSIDDLIPTVIVERTMGGFEIEAIGAREDYVPVYALGSDDPVGYRRKDIPIEGLS